MQYLSASQISTADPKESGCLRKWHFEKVLGKKRPPTKATARGTSVHEDIEEYLKTGEKPKLPLVATGFHFIPDPIKIVDGKPDLLIEREIAQRPDDERPPNESNRDEILRNPILRIEDIPIVGKLDVIHSRGINKDLDTTQDPEGTVELLDWKSTSAVKWTKQARDLPKLPQMAIYGEWAYETQSHIKALRLSHGYFIEEGGSKKVSLLVHREDLQPTINHVRTIVKTIVDAAKETNNDLLDANTNACYAYGGCPHRTYCQAYLKKTNRTASPLASFVGRSAAERLTFTQSKEDMGLLDTLKSDLGTEETAMRTKIQMQQDADRLKPLLTRLDAFAEANADINLGTPSYQGAAAQAYCVVKGITIAPSVTGRGNLGADSAGSVIEVEQFLAQLEDAASKGQIHKPAEPMLMSKIAESKEAALPPIVIKVDADPRLSEAAHLQADDDAPVTFIERQEDLRHTRTISGAVEIETKRRGRKKGSKNPSQPEKTEDVTEEPFNLLVDVEHEGYYSVKSFHPILDSLCAELAALTGDSDLRAAGVREHDGKLVFAKDDSPLAFGRWEGALAALVRERELLPGTYALNTRGSKAAEVVADALRERCRKTNGVFVWGRR